MIDVEKLTPEEIQQMTDEEMHAYFAEKYDAEWYEDLSKLDPYDKIVEEWVHRMTSGIYA